MSLIANPSVLFLDEPTTGLDPRSRLGMWDVIEDLAADGTTVLLTTQYLEEADRLAEQIVVIDQDGSSLKELQMNSNSDGRSTTPVSIARRNRELAMSVLTPLCTGRVEVRDDRIFEAPITAGDRVVPTVIRALDDAGVDVLDVVVRRPSLDDVFLALTGHVVSAEEATSVNRLQATLHDSFVEAERHLRVIPRNIELLIFATIQPIMFLALFAYVFGGSISIPGSITTTSSSCQEFSASPLSSGQRSPRLVSQKIFRKALSTVCVHCR